MAIGGSVAGTAKVLLTADTANFDRGMASSRASFHGHVDGIEKDTDLMSRGVLAGSGAFTHLGRSLAFASGAFLGAAGFTSVVKDAIQQTEALQTQTIRASQVFEGSADVIRKWSDSTVRSLGLASAQSLELANDTGAFLKSMGVAPATAAEYTKGLVTIGDQLARIKGVDPSEALSAINSALAGRGKALKALGIDVDSASIKEKALQDGLVKSVPVTEAVTLAQNTLAVARAKAADALAKYGAGTTQYVSAQDTAARAQTALNKAVDGQALPLTNAQKAYVAYQLIMERSGQTAQAYTRWTHTLAGEQVSLKADVQQLEEGLGKALLPTIQNVVKALSGWLGNTKNQQRVQNDLKDTVSVLTGTVKVLAGGFKTLAGAVGGSKHAVELLAGAFALLKIGGWTSSILGLIGVRGSLKGMLGIGTAAETSTGEVVGLRAALMSLGGAGVLGALAGLGAALVILEKKASFGLSNTTDTSTGGTINGHKVSSGAQGEFSVSTGGAHSIQYDGGKWYDTDTGNTITAAQAAQKLGVSQKALGQQVAGFTSGGVPGQLAGLEGVKPGIVGTARSLGVGSGGVYQTGGGHSGVAKPGSVFDCSGYIYQVFTQNGFKGFPGTSETQWATHSGPNWTSTGIMPNSAQPGDVVFMVGSPEYPSPGHVGIVTSGTGQNAQVMQYYSSGKPADTIPMSQIGDMVGIKRFYLVKKEAGAGASTPPAGASAAASTASTGASGLVVGKAAKKPKAQPLIPTKFGEAISAAALTKGVGDDIKAYNSAINEVSQAIAGTKKGSESRTKLEKLLATYEDARNKLAAPIAEAAIAKATPKVTGVAAVETAISNLQSGQGTKVVNVAGIGKILTGIVLTPTVAAWNKIVTQLKAKYKAAQDRLNSLSRSLKKAKAARFPNKSLIAWLQSQIKSAQKLMGEIKADISTALTEINQLKADAKDKAQQDAKEAEDTAESGAADLPTSIQQLEANASLTGSAADENTYLTAADQFLSGELTTGLVAGTSLALTPEARVAVTNALANIRQQERDLAAQSAAPSSPDGGTQSVADAVAAAVVPDTSTIIDAITQRNAYLSGLTDLRSFESNLLTSAVGGSTINVTNNFAAAPSDPHIFTSSLQFELQALVNG